MPASPRPPRRVALVIETSNAYARGLLRGIHRHAQERGRWDITLAEHGRGELPPESLAAWSGDGVIARIETAAIAAAVGRLREAGLPVVDVSAAGLLPGVPCVETDDDAIAALAVGHFCDRGFRRLAFLGEPRFRWSDNRARGFTTAAAARGLAVEQFPRTRTAAGDFPAALDRWLAALAGPVAVFACYDAMGRQAIESCRRLGRAVPDEVAVLGVDDDELLSGLCSTPLSSIVPDAEGAGWLAAETLDRLMAGLPVTQPLRLLPPLGIAARHSTDTMSIDEPCVVAALRFIRDHGCRGIKAQDVVAAVGTTRRILESRFLRHVGHSVHEEIVRVQFRRVEELLRVTRLPLAEIADRTGFRHAEYLSVAFARRHGMPPGAWRRLRPAGPA